MITKFIKYLKSKQLKDPKINDFVIVKTNFKDDLLNEFLENSIGQIEEIISNDDFPYIIKFDEIIPVYQTYKMRANKTELKYWSKNKEDLEIYLNIDKYNV